MPGIGLLQLVGRKSGGASGRELLTADSYEFNNLMDVSQVFLTASTLLQMKAP